MNCANWEERVALYAGGDLPPADAESVARHLGECAACRKFAVDLQGSLELLREAHDEQPALADYAAVRARVIANIQNAPSPWWRRVWVYGSAMAAAALVLLLLAPDRNTPVLPPLPVPQAVIAAAPLETSRPVVLKAAHHKPHVRPRPLVARSEPGQPIVVKLVTDDPDVVIYWITDNSGE
jgi:anti-sigma factor RsiW